MKYITEYQDVKLVILNCDIKVKFEKILEGSFEDLELIVTKNPCLYVP